MQNVKIKSIKKLNKKNDRYDLTINTTKNFFANNILIHNTSFIASHILTNRKLSLLEKLLVKCGVKLQTSEYGYLFSSRCVIKNRYDLQSNKGSFYSHDIYTEMGYRIKNCIEPGISIYGEIVGYLPSGSYIQQDYDYGCMSGQMQLYVYRISSTNVAGHVTEFTTPQIQRYCRKYGLETVPIHYYGHAGSYYDRTVNDSEYPDIHMLSIVDIDKWRAEFLALLIEQHLEKECSYCKNNVPAEGICVSIERDNPEIFKLKSNAFYQMATAELDAGVVDMETLQEGLVDEQT